MNGVMGGMWEKGDVNLGDCKIMTVRDQGSNWEVNTESVK
jgi:hypothetical protein